MEAGWSHVTSMMEVDGGGQLMQMDLGMRMSRDAALVAAHPLHWAPEPNNTNQHNFPTFSHDSLIQILPKTHVNDCQSSAYYS